MKRPIKSWLTGIAVLVSLIEILDLSAGGASLICKSWIKLPRSHDRRLVGMWHGVWRFMDEPNSRPRWTILGADGIGWVRSREEGSWARFDWGSEEGVLYTRRMATDSWSGTRRPYGLSADGKSITFSNVDMFDLVADSMQRK